MINAGLLPYGTTLADGQNPLSPQGLISTPTVVNGAAYVPEGRVESSGSEQKIASKETKAATEKLQSAQSDELAAMDRQKETAVQLEGLDAQGAQALSDSAQKRQDDLDALNEQKEQWRAKREAERHSELEEFKRLQSSTTLGDPSPLRQLVSAIAIGFGAYAASRNGGPNQAFEIFKNKEESARRAREEELKRATEKMMASGKSADEVMKFFDQQHDHIEKTFAARNDLALKQVAAVKATIPQAGDRADIAKAQLQQRGAELDQKFRSGYDKTVKSNTQVSTGAKAGGEQAADSSTKQAVITAREAERSMNELGDFIKKNPKAWKEFQKASVAEAELEAAKQGNEKLISAAQGFGVAKVAIDQRLKSPEARHINAMIAPMITAKAREMDPTGALNKDAYINASKSLNLFTGPAEEVAKKAYEYGAKNKRIGDQYVEMTPALRQKQPAAVQGPAPAKISYTQEEKDALDWARAHPGPDADNIKESIRRKKGIK